MTKATTATRGATTKHARYARNVAIQQISVGSRTSNEEGMTIGKQKRMSSRGKHISPSVMVHELNTLRIMMGLVTAKMIDL
jgi:hypothetical protein